jgi:hypothetical protein
MILLPKALTKTEWKEIAAFPVILESVDIAPGDEAADLLANRTFGDRVHYVSEATDYAGPLYIIRPFSRSKPPFLLIRENGVLVLATQIDGPK